MANKSVTKTAGTNKSFIDRMGGQKFIVLLIVIAMFIFFCAMSPQFRKYTTVVSILDYSYYIALMAIGVAFPLMTGGVDLSIGTGLICYSLIGGYLVVHQGWPTAAGMVVSILMGVAFGVINGCLVSLMELPAFLATLCTCMITRGFGSLIVGGFGIPWPTAAAPGGWFRSIFKIKMGGQNIPIGFLWIILLVIIMTFVLNHTKMGRYTLAIGKDLVIDPLYRQTYLAGVELDLTRREFDLLYFLASNPGQVFSRAQLYRNVWCSDNDFAIDETVKTCIKALRRKLAPAGREYIQNLRGVGYRFVG